MITHLEGLSIIGSSRGSRRGQSFRSQDPSTAESLDPDYYAASHDELDEAVRLAEEAFEILVCKPGNERGKLLRAIARELESARADLLERAPQETGLPVARINGETTRTIAQLHLFADLLEEGSWVDARIDRAQPNRSPAPKPDVRSMLQGIGPVAVFAASNFPLAFSVAGGDTASALAAGCPVIVKAHHAHPGVSEIAGLAIARAVAETGFPPGTFSLLFGSGRDIGQALVRHPGMKAVGFTGSRAGGRALFDIAAARSEPIPVYAEMSSINPILILPGALQADAHEELAKGLLQSVTLGAGQFCTNPGLVLLCEGREASEFMKRFADGVRTSAPATMLSAGIYAAYSEGLDRKRKHMSVLEFAKSDQDGTRHQGAAAVFSVKAKAFLQDPSLMEEVFGPSTLFVLGSPEELLEVAHGLEGQLTASIFAQADELANHGELVRVLRRKAGRLIFNQFPTGVEVCHSMVHGGPYPATTDGRSTSVGTSAILRFCRPVCYQNFPDQKLPSELKESNPLKILRRKDGLLSGQTT